MCPDASLEPARTHAPRRALPAPRPDPAPSLAWTEHEDPERGQASPGESRRLLEPPTDSPVKLKCSLQAGLTHGVWDSPRKPDKCSPTKFVKTKAKTKYEKMKKKLLAILKPPYFILSTIVIMVCVHAWGPERLRSQLEWSPGAWWREPWRLVTYGFVHASAGHLALNALVALFVGWRLEQEQSAWRVVVVWTGGVVAGALGAGALHPHTYVVGASAAVYALLTAHIPNVVHRFGHIPLWWFRPLSVVLLAGVGQLAHGHAGAVVAWAAHLFGAAVGIPLAFLVFTGENSCKSHVVVCRLVSAAVLVGGVAAAGVFYADVFFATKASLHRCPNVAEDQEAGISTHVTFSFDT